jgi:deoxyribonuclease-4
MKEIKKIADELKQKKVKTLLGAETVGKKTAFGGLDEVINLAHDIDGLVPVLDLAHMHARGDFTIKTEDDYRRIFSKVEKDLPNYMSSFHFHFSEIEYSDKGERKHLPLGTRNIPPYKALIKVLIENGYSGTIICESPKIDMDAQLMQREYEKLLKKN